MTHISVDSSPPTQAVMLIHQESHSVNHLLKNAPIYIFNTMLIREIFLNLFYSQNIRNEYIYACIHNDKIYNKHYEMFFYTFKMFWVKEYQQTLFVLITFFSLS